MTISALPSASGRDAAGNMSQPSPVAPSPRPIQVRTVGRSPWASPQPIIVSCTDPNRISAPTAAPIRP